MPGSVAIGIAFADASGSAVSTAAAKSVFIIFIARFLSIPSPRCSRRLSIQLGIGEAAALNLGHETERFLQSRQFDANTTNNEAELIAERLTRRLARRWLATHETIAALLQVKEPEAVARSGR